MATDQLGSSPGVGRLAALALPVGPKAATWRQLLVYSRHTVAYLEKCAKEFGTPFTMRLAGYPPLVILAEPDAVRDVFRAEATALHSGEGNEFLSVTVGENSVLVLDEERHARQRSALTPAMRGERMRGMTDAVWTESVAAVNAWPVGRSFAALPWMRRIALRVILRSTLGLTSGPELDRFEELVEGLLAHSRSRYALIWVRIVPDALVRAPWVGFQRRLRELNKALFELIGRRRKEPDSTRAANILDDMLAARDDKGEAFSDEEVRDAVVTMTVAGYDTTAVALAWSLEQIVPRAEVVERIRAESASVAGLEMLMAKRPYLDAAIREALRIRTIFPFVVRLTKRTFTAGGRDYPPGVLLCPCGHLIHRREDIYPEPERFDPGRFLARSFGLDEWLPFGGGNRTCIGMTFALMEMRVVLAAILTHVRLQRPAGAVSRVVRRGLALGPDDDCRVVVSERY